MTIQEKAQKYVDQFEVIKIQDTDNTRAILKDSADEKLKNAVREAHGDRMPNDFVFSTFLSLLEKITDYNTDSMDFFDETRNEIVDSLVDVYTSQLTAWLHEDVNNVYYLETAIANGATDGFNLLSMAQFAAIDEIFPYVQELLNN